MGGGEGGGSTASAPGARRGAALERARASQAGKRDGPPLSLAPPLTPGCWARGSRCCALPLTRCCRRARKARRRGRGTRTARPYCLAPARTRAGRQASRRVGRRRQAGGVRADTDKLGAAAAAAAAGVGVQGWNAPPRPHSPRERAPFCRAESGAPAWRPLLSRPPAPPPPGLGLAPQRTTSWWAPACRGRG